MSDCRQIAKRSRLVASHSFWCGTGRRFRLLINATIGLLVEKLLALMRSLGKHQPYLRTKFFRAHIV
jgi:hypothetical protein